MNDEIGHSALMRKALAKIRALQTALEKADSARREPIAIVGMGCRFPGIADDPESYWRLLSTGFDAITEVPHSRWPINDYFDPDPDAPGKMYTRHGGFLTDIDQFDATFFGSSPREAMNMDPQQRLLLEVAWEALENAGQVPGEVAATGVYIGSFMDDYLQMNFHDSDVTELDSYSTLGLLRGVVAGRLAYVLNLHGPTVQLDTACSSSLVAIHLACRALRARECDLALAGGVNLILAPEITVGLCRMKAMAADGHCKSFDASADGYVRGEGCGIVVLKRLSDALADGDLVHAVIRGSAVNHDGRSNGLTAPSGTAQQAVIRQALADANVDPGDVQLVEAHGTGTALGDPIEALALAEVLCRGRDAHQPLYVGSVKSNFGHLESAAGVAALIKAALSLQHGKIPPSLHFDNPNPHIPWDRLPITVPIELMDWPRAENQFAGVSAFGMSGTNVHMVVERAPDEAHQALRVRAADHAPVVEANGFHLLTLSAASPQALDALAQKYVSFFGSAAESSLADICYSSNRGRKHFDHRLAIVADTVASAVGRLTDSSRTRPPPVRRAKRPRIAFLFPGQGSQIAGMGETLYAEAPVFRGVVDRCDEILRPILGRRLGEILFPRGAQEHDGGVPNQQPLEAFAQPAIFVLEHALATLWKSWGIEADVVLGHSVGEFAAACTAGVLDLEDGLKLIAERMRLMNALPRIGAMAAIFSPEDRIRAAIRSHGENLSIAALNGSHVVISGKREDVQAITEQFRAEGVDARPLNVAHGFHSKLMDPVLEPFERTVSSTMLRRPECAFISGVLGDRVESELTQPSYWTQHIRQPVRFADSVRTLADLDCGFVIEVGPQPTLIGMARQILENGQDTPLDVRMLPSLRPKHSEWKQMLESLGAIYEGGRDIDWASGPRRGAKAVLPTYPFQRSKFWVATKTGRAGHREAPGSERLGRRVPSPFSPEIRFESRLSANWPRYLKDHGLDGSIVVSAATYLSMALESAVELHAAQACSLHDLQFPSALSFSEEASQVLQLIVSPASRDSSAFRFASLHDEARPFEDSSWLTHCSGTLEHGPVAVAGRCELEELQARQLDNPGGQTSRLDAGFTIGPSFHWVADVNLGRQEALCRIVSPLEAGASEAFQLHPGLLDSCLRMLGLCLPGDVRLDDGIYAPFHIAALRFAGRPDPNATLWCHAQASAISEARIVGDIRLFDDAGHIVMEVNGFEARKVPLSSLVGQAGGDQARGLPLLHVEWEPADTGEMPPPRSDLSWLILSEAPEVAGELLSILKRRGDSVLVASRGATFSSASEDHVVIDPRDRDQLRRLMQELTGDGARRELNIIDLLGVSGVCEAGTTVQHLKDAQSRVGRGLLGLLQSLEDSGIAARLWIVTRGAQAVCTSDQIDPTHSWIWGLGKVVAMEYPHWRCVRVDLDPGLATAKQGSREEIELLVEQCAAAGNESEVAFRDGLCYVPRLVQRRVDAAGGAGKIRFREDASYLVTGAFGALGVHVARWLVAHGARHLVLASRSGSSSAPIVAELEGSGARVFLFNADVADSEAVARLFDAARASMPPIKGILHAAGGLDDALLQDLTWERFEHVFGPKVHGSWNLHCSSLDLDLDFFVCFSSAASLIGSKGQGNYAAANSFMDALMHYRRCLGYPALAVNWGAWDEAGMAARMGDRVRDRMQAIGLEPITPEAGLETLGQLMCGDAGQVGVIPADWPRVLAAVFEAPPKLFSKLAGSGVETKRRILTLLEEATAARRRGVLEHCIRELILSVMGWDPFPSTDNDHGFFELGMDSLMSLDLRNRLQVELDRPLPSTMTFEYPSIPELADYLITEVLPEELSGAQLRPGAEQPQKTSEADVMTDGELADLLATRIPALKGSGN